MPLDQGARRKKPGYPLVARFRDNSTDPEATSIRWNSGGREVVDFFFAEEFVDVQHDQQLIF